MRDAIEAGGGSDPQKAREARYREANGSVVAVMAVADAEQAELQAEVDRLRDGADPAPRAENAYPTAGQLWHELLRADTQKRLDRLDYLIGEASTAAYMRVRGGAARAESAEAALASEREAHAGLRARVEAVLADRDHSDTCSDALSPDAGYPCTCFRADLRTALAADPAAPVAAEEGGEQEAGEWDRRGGSMWLNREEWGVIIDALIQHRSHADHRKAVNSESTSDVRSGMCADLIGRISEAAKSLPAPSGSDEQGNRSATPDANGAHDTKGGAK